MTKAPSRLRKRRLPACAAEFGSLDAVGRGRIAGSLCQWRVWLNSFIAGGENASTSGSPVISSRKVAPRLCLNPRAASFLKKALKPLFAICALAPVFAIHHASAQLYWDGPNTIPDGILDGSSGSWNLTDPFWATTSADTAHVPWTNGNAAVFTTTVVSATPFVVTVDAQISPTSISFQTTSTNFTIATGTGALNLTGNVPITVASGVASTISATLINGTSVGSITVNGAGTLTIDDSANATKNSYSGGTTLSDGTLIINSDATMGNATAIGTGPLTITSSGGPTTLGSTATAASTSTSAGLAAALANEPSNGNVSLVLNNPVFVQGSFSVLNGGATNGDIYFTGLVTLDSTRTITGLTAQGQVHFSGGITGASGIGINFLGASSPYTAFIYDGVTPSTYTGLTTVGNGAFLVLEQSINDQAVIGPVTVSAGGSLDLLASQQTATNITLTVNSAGILIPGGGQFQGFELQTFSDTIGTLNGNSTGTVGIGTGVLTVSNGNFSGNIVDSVTSGTLSSGLPYGSLAMVGPGTLTLSGINTYQAATNVTGGILQAGSNTGFSPNSAFTVTTPGILDVHGFDPTVGSLAGNGVVTNSSTTPGTLITGLNGTSTSFTGSLQDGAGTLGLLKTGFGTFTISNSTYSGATTVVQGVLQAATTTAFSSRSAFTVGAAGLLDLNGFNNSIGSLAGAGTVTNLSATPAVLTTGLDNTNSNFSGTIQDGKSRISLIKTGTGAMTLSSPNTFTGGTVLQNGALIIDSIVALGAGDMTVTGGALQGGGSATDIEVGGSYKQTGGELDLRIGGTKPGTYDRLAVVGSASLGGRLNIITTNGFFPARGTDLTIVSAAGGVTGRFQQVTGSLADGLLINLSVEYLPTEVVLEFGGTNFSSIMDLTPNQRAVAAALDGVVTNKNFTRALDYLEALPLKSLPAAFDRIAPEEYGAIYQISTAAAKMQASAIENRLDAVHATHAPVGAGGPAGSPDGKTSSGAPAQPDSLVGVFANANGDFVSVGDSSNAAGYNFDSGGVTFGADYRFSENFVAGALFNYTRTRADLASNGRLDSDGFRGGVYASLFGDGAYVNAFLGAGYNDYALKRAGLDAAVRGDTSGGEFNGVLQSGYDAHWGAVTFGPVTSLEYTYTGLSSLNEQGSLDPLRISSSREQSVRTNIGARATYEWHVGSYVLTPEIRATWQHEFADVTDSTTASMLFGSPDFTVTSSPIGRNSLLLNVGFTLTITPQIAAYVFYDGELGRMNYQESNILVGIRANF